MDDDYYDAFDGEQANGVLNVRASDGGIPDYTYKIHV